MIRDYKGETVVLLTRLIESKLPKKQLRKQIDLIINNFRDKVMDSQNNYIEKLEQNNRNFNIIKQLLK